MGNISLLSDVALLERLPVLVCGVQFHGWRRVSRQARAGSGAREPCGPERRRDADPRARARRAHRPRAEAPTRHGQAAQAASTEAWFPPRAARGRATGLGTRRLSVRVFRRGGAALSGASLPHARAPGAVRAAWPAD